MIAPDKSSSNSPQNVMRSIERAMGGAAGTSTAKQRQAQECVYDAWEAATADDALELIHEALELDSRNVDAWLMLLHACDYSTDERIEFLRKLVDMGAKNLGSKIMKQKGHFWGVLETRPYMRARAELASAYQEAGRPEDAVKEYEGMLELNPNDNQGNRYCLMGLYLQLDRVDKARGLFEKYDEREFSAIWAWGYVLERLIAGAEDDAVAALDDARKQNAHAEAYIKGHLKIPKRMPDQYAVGSREEAIICADVLRPAWEQHPEALAWIKRQKKS